MAARSSRSRRSAPARSALPAGTALVETLLGAWRAVARIDVDGVALLRSRGVTRRAHSAVPLDPPSDPEDLDALIDRVHALTAADGRALWRIFELPGLPPAHTALDQALDARGLVTEAPCEILGRDLASPPRGDAAVRFEVGLPPADWSEAHWRLAPRAGEEARTTLHDIMAGTPAIYATLPRPGTDGARPEDVAAVGRAALVPVRKTLVTVVDALAVDPDHRRQGHGRTVLDALLGAAHQQDVRAALLEVESDNAAARALYRRAGFTRLGGCHYRVGA